ncbi:MAG: crotonase/enoyl-CoA hydratase family protein [Labilithrix sp.]
MSTAIEVQKHEGVAEVTLAGPGKGNAMGPDFFRELPKIFDDLDRDDDVRAVLVRGKGGVFSYGLDLKAMAPLLMPVFSAESPAKERTKFLRLIDELRAGFDAVERCSKPVIAAVAGACIGGGVDLISACDVRFCAKDAKFSVREVKLAIVADMGSLQRLPRIIGHGATRELAFTGKDIDATEAHRLHLVNDVLDDEAALLDRARATAREIAANPPLTVQGVKAVLNYAEESRIRESEKFVAVWNAAFLASKDLMEAMSAFMEKRPAKFKGE